MISSSVLDSAVLKYAFYGFTILTSPRNIIVVVIAVVVINIAEKGGYTCTYREVTSNPFSTE